jgi:glycosyltransferase involved in cell wall biosynthesis
MTILPDHQLRPRRSKLHSLASVPKQKDPPSGLERIRIIHIINDLSIGGAEMMLYKLLSEVDQDRFDPVVVSLRTRGKLNGRIEALGIPIYSVAMRLPLPTPTSCWRLIRLVRRLDPDLIQGWMYHGNLAAQMAGAFVRKVPVVWNVRQSLYGFDYEKRSTAAVIRVSASLSNLPARIIYNSRIAAAQHGAIGYKLQNSVVIPNGFATSLFTPSLEARRSVRTELGVADDTVLIGLVSRHHAVKDHTNFLHGAALLLRSHPEVQFVLCGENVNWVNPSLCSLIDELKLAERIHLLGQRQDMARITAALDVATSSSCAESFPNVIGEAMSCGVPCVVTDVGDLVWIVGETGRVVPPRNPQALAEGMRELVELGTDARAAIGKAARDRIIKHFPLKEIECLYEALYEGVLHPAGSALPLSGSNVRYHEFGEHPAAIISEVDSSALERPAAVGTE